MLGSSFSKVSKCRARITFRDLPARHRVLVASTLDIPATRLTKAFSCAIEPIHVGKNTTPTKRAYEAETEADAANLMNGHPDPSSSRPIDYTPSPENRSQAQRDQTTGEKVSISKRHKPSARPTTPHTAKLFSRPRNQAEKIPHNMSPVMKSSESTFSSESNSSVHLDALSSFRITQEAVASGTPSAPGKIKEPVINSK